MYWKNTETPTFAGDAGSGNAPAIAETMELVDRDGSTVATFSKSVDGTLSMNVNGGATSAELDRFNDVSAYSETVTAAGAVSVSKLYTALELTGAGAVTLAAPDGSMTGQVKVIEMTADNGDVTLALTNVVGGSAATTATFDAVGEILILVAASAKWVVIKEQGVTLS